jgi:hypothetical protein
MLRGTRQGPSILCGIWTPRKNRLATTLQGIYLCERERHWWHTTQISGLEGRRHDWVFMSASTPFDHRPPSECVSDPLNGLHQCLSYPHIQLPCSVARQDIYTKQIRGYLHKRGAATYCPCNCNCLILGAARSGSCFVAPVRAPVSSAVSGPPGKTGSLRFTTG